MCPQKGTDFIIDHLNSDHFTDVLLCLLQNNFSISDMMDVDVDHYCKGNEIMLTFTCEKIFYFNDFYYIP